MENDDTELGLMNKYCRISKRALIFAVTLLKRLKDTSKDTRYDSE